MSQAQSIVDALGGFDNIVEIEPCITRLRCDWRTVPSWTSRP